MQNTPTSFFFSGRRRHTSCSRDWSSDVCSSDLLVRRLALPTALAFGLFFGLAVSTGWMPVLQFLHQTPFGVTDPVFGRDVAYYVFTLPIVTGVLAILNVLVTLSLLACGALYTLRRDVVFY